MPPSTHRSPPRPLLYLALVLLFVVWSNSFHAIAYFRHHLGLPALTLVTLRYGVVAPFCLLWCLWRGREFRRLMRDAWARVVLIGLLLVPAYNLALNWGQGRVPPATASLIISMNPVATFLFALAFLGERARWSKILGLVISVLGVYLLVSAQYQSFGRGYLRAALVVLMAPISWALGTVTGKTLTDATDPVLLTFAATGLASLPFFILLLAGTGGVHQVIAQLNWVGWAAWMHLSVLCTLVGFAVWFWALRYLAASSVAAFVFLNPPLTSLFGVVWGTEAFHWQTALFGTVTLLGVALTAGLLWPSGDHAAAEGWEKTASLLLKSRRHRS